MSKQEDILARADNKLKTLEASVIPSEVWYWAGGSLKTVPDGYYCFQVLEDAVFTVFTIDVAATSANPAGLVGPTFAAGTVWYLRPTAIRLSVAGGKLLFYKL